MIHSHKIKIALSALPKNDWWGSGIVAYPDNDMMVDGAQPNQSVLEHEYRELVTLIEPVSYTHLTLPTTPYV